MLLVHPQCGLVICYFNWKCPSIYPVSSTNSVVIRTDYDRFLRRQKNVLKTSTSRESLMAVSSAFCLRFVYVLSLVKTAWDMRLYLMPRSMCLSMPLMPSLIYQVSFYVSMCPCLITALCFPFSSINPLTFNTHGLQTEIVILYLGVLRPVNSNSHSHCNANC